MSQESFKSKNRRNVCSGCTKRLACSALDSICELVTPCDVCEIRDKCTSMCDQMDAYLQRGNKREFRVEQVTEGDKALLLPVVTEQPSVPSQKTVLWDILNDSDKHLLTEHFIKGRSQEDIAKELGVTRQRISSRLYGNATKFGILHKLKTFHKFRELTLRFYGVLPQKYKDLLFARYVNLKEPKQLIGYGMPLMMVYRRLTRGRALLLKLEKTHGQDNSDSQVYRFTTKDENGPGEH